MMTGVTGPAAHPGLLAPIGLLQNININLRLPVKVQHSDNTVQNVSAIDKSLRVE